ncbi:Eukaryotic translation initiation factor 2A [Operophtera brumata]|uniref:Eukaryotic translation initiation factor 2A n=1 Tax=Operophtera brumata TaxID=104452 RepID=A0A0L7LDZ9_OPEBR|nr:Eukaryotic translation initiation factor 2A [Operophtera brumata]
MSTSPHIAGLTSKNIFLIEFGEPFGQKILRDETTTNVRNIIYSPKGAYLAYRTDKKCSDWSVTAVIEGNIKDMFFSPLDTYFTVWEMFVMTKDNPQVSYDFLEPRWSSDEKLFAIQMSNRVLIYEDTKLDRYTHHILADNLKSFSMSPSPAPTYYISVDKTGGSYYGKQSLSYGDVDKTGGSYYGKQSLSYGDVWAVRGYKKLGACAAPDTTFLQWDPRGETFLTATTYPRLTVANGYKIWHYTGVLMHKHVCTEKENLLSITWQPGTWPKSELSRSAPKGIEDSTPKPVGAYRPPGARNKPSTFTLHEHEKPHKPGESLNGNSIETSAGAEEEA